MMTRRIKKICIVIGILFCLLIIGITVFFSIPYSKTHSEFISIKKNFLIDSLMDPELFTEKDIAHLPIPVKKYFHHCGFIGKPKMQLMKAVYKDVKFKFGKEKPEVIIDYVQYNSAEAPARIAYIDSTMYGIPFEGLDSYTAGNGAMKGVLAKLITLFNQTGETMDQASLVTFLSECLLIPNVALQEYISWKEIDGLHAMAAISFYGRTASGIFTFNEEGELCSFTTNDRKATSTDGKSENVKWSVVFSEYAETNGFQKPTEFQAIWHYDDGDLIYFDGKDVTVEYDPHN